jgi:hypothetical protein
MYVKETKKKILCLLLGGLRQKWAPSTLGAVNKLVCRCFSAYAAIALPLRD